MSTPTRFRGQIKSVGTDYGFIDCPETKEEFGRDVYIKRGELPDRVWRVSQIISFEICFSEKGRPQARELRFGPNDQEIPGCSNTIFPETETPGSNSAPTTEAKTEIADEAEAAEEARATQEAATTEDAPAAEALTATLPTAAPSRIRDVAVRDESPNSKGTPCSSSQTGRSPSSIEQHLQSKPWADVVDDLLDEAGVDDHLDDIVGDEREDGAERSRLKEKRKNWRRKGLPLRSLKPALEEADSDDVPLRRRGLPLQSAPRLPARRPPSHSPPPAPSQVQQRGAGRGLQLRVLRRPRSRSSASRSCSPSPLVREERDVDDLDPLNESLEGPPAELAKVGNTPLKADSPEFTPGAAAMASAPTGSTTLSAEAPSFTPGVKAAETERFSVSGLQQAGADMQYTAGNVDMYNNYGDYGYESWQQDYGADYNGVYGDYTGYGPAPAWQYGSEMDPNDPKANPPPFEPGAGRLSANASEFRPGQQAFTGGKGHEGSAKAAGHGASPILRTRPPAYKDVRLEEQQTAQSVDERFIQGQKRNEPLPSEESTTWDIGAAVRDQWADPEDDGPWGDDDAWHATNSGAQCWRRGGGGWARDGWHKDDWKRDGWASDWHGSRWRDRNNRRNGWDDWGEWSSWLGHSDWVDRGWRHQGKWKRSGWNRQERISEEVCTETDSSEDEEVSHAVAAGEAPLPRPLVDESDEATYSSGTDDSGYNKPAPQKANIDAAAFHKIALGHLLGGRRATRQQQQPPEEEQQQQQLSEEEHQDRPEEQPEVQQPEE